MDWVYLSPHFDDAVFSCGGLLWEQTHTGESTTIWTVCAGEPLPGEISEFAQMHHLRWGSGEDAVAQRKLEDQLACWRVGAAYHYLPIPDCIYRRLGEDYFRLKPARKKPPLNSQHLYTSLPEILGPLKPEEEGLVDQLSQQLAKTLPAGSQLVCPLSLGGHADHRLTRRAAETLNRSLWYYADFPYVVRDTAQVEQLKQAGWTSTTFPVSPDGVEAWFEAMAAHKSQISTFWDDLGALRSMLQAYIDQNGGASLWQPPAEPTEDQLQPES